MSVFSDAFSSALEDVYATFGTSARYVSPDFVTTACVIVIGGADDVASLGNVQIVAGQTIVEVRASELAAPKKGGTFRADNREFKIVAAPKNEDPDRLVWTCICDLQPAL
ncbi:MAG: hypothetical protein AB7F41_14635 [Methylocystis sp.]|uniref:head-tail joining protein n=1 Tax=Methylocystis sp. TaxID=1911079 RepID=UPI003D0D340E